jgi:hypothetical protein
VTRLCGWQDYKFKWPVEEVLWARMPLQRFLLLFKCLLEETEELQNASNRITTVNVSLQIHYLLSSSRQKPYCQSAHEVGFNKMK